MPNDFKVGEDWTDSDKDFSTTGTLASGAQTVTGDIDASGTIEGAVVNQGVNNVLDDSDLITNGGDVVESSDIINSGPSAPAITFAGQWWFDTANNFLKLRNEANDAWLSVWDLTNNKPVITNLLSSEIIALIDADAIAGTLLAPAIAGDGLVQDGSGNLDVNVDDATLEVATDVVQVKAGGSVISVSANDTTPGVLNGKLVAGDNISLTEGNDAGDEILTVSGSLLYSDPSANDVDGDTKADFVSYEIPADTLEVGDLLRISATISATSLNASSYVQLSIGPVEYGVGTMTAGNDCIIISLELLVRSTTDLRTKNLYFGVIGGVDTLINPGVGVIASTVDTTSAIIVSIAATNGSPADSVRCDSFYLELIKA